ncbi:MAG: BamA/TamA family outer membrane protein [Saprospiraceae bacterium]|nr:BamA/TamA family outer membrane protein [Saprospiraceae bacterium]
MRLLLYTTFLFLSLNICAQNTPTAAIIRDFAFEGNRKTKTAVLTRELTIKIGDTIPLSKLAVVLEENRLRLLNTNLFNEVKINVKNWSLDDKVTITISLVERWYFYPIPIFEIADRDFNVWWKEQHHDLRRTNYGIRLVHSNFTGRRDPLSALIRFGYTPRFSGSYSFPYLDKKQTVGASVGFYYWTNREIGYTTLNNRLIFYKKPDKNVLTGFSTNIGVGYRPGLFQGHNWSLGYSKQTLDTAISENRNQDYFLNRKTEQNYFWASYDFAHDNRDFRPYPTKGHLFNLNIGKSGLFKTDDVNLLSISAKWSQYTRLSKKLLLETIVRGKTTLSSDVLPYNFQRAIGYGADYLRGYELFVVDGYNFGVLKNSFRFQLIDKDYDLSRYTQKYKPLSGFKTLPVKCFLSFNSDLAYVHTPQYKAVNNFNNRLLYGTGVGLDVLAYNGMLWQFEYSFNHIGKGGFYLHYKSGF